jgi:YHS domain-containing protein
VLGPRSPAEGWEVVDPYCGMKLRRSEAAATMEHRGRTYYFCLPDHRDAFARDPDRYLSAGAVDAGRSDEAESDPDASADVAVR